MSGSSFFRDAAASRPFVRRLLQAALAVGVFLLQTAFAIDPERAISQYVHDHWGTEQGFPRGPVYAITQTPDGYLWFGTEAGLVRFDGWKFSLIKDASGALSITGVFGLASESDGSLLVRLPDLTIVRYSKGVFQRPIIDAEKYSSVSTMSTAAQEEILLWKMDDGVFNLHRGSMQKLGSATELPRSPVISLARTHDGDVWMGTRDAGLFHLAAGHASSVRAGLPDSKINCLLPEGDRDLLVGTDNGIVRWNGTALVPAGLPASIRQLQALVMVRDRDANVWVGTDSRGLLRLNSQGIAQLDLAEGTSPQAVTALFEDREGSLWVGHADGIERLRDSAFVTYSNPEGLPADGSKPVFVDSAYRLWFPAVSGGLWWARNGQHGHVDYDGLNRDIIYSIAGSGEELWVGRQRGGLTRLRFEGAGATAKTYREPDGLAQDSVYSVYLARDGTVWVGTLSGGVSRLRDGKFTSFTTADGLASDTVASILEGSDGTMWFATPGGLSAFSGGRWRTFGTADGLPSDNVNCMFEDIGGVLWLGTASGVAFRDQGVFRTPPSDVPAPLRAQIFGIAGDRYGALWMATSGAVLRVSREKLWRNTLREEDIRTFGLADGLRGVEGVKRHPSVVTDGLGRIWFSLNRGISMVDPARLTRNSAPALVHVQTISVNGRPISIRGVVHIPGGPKRITVGYAGLSLSVPDRVRYRYWLEGYDHAWSETVAGREAAYTNLGPGRYRFRVTASNADGAWSGHEDALAFEVDPLFWQSAWSQFGAAAAGLALAFALYRLRLRQLARRLNMRFEERLAERTRIAQELHDTLLQGFLSASMQVHVATDSLPEDSSAKPMLSHALQLMRQVIDEGRNAVRGLRSAHSASLNLEQAFSRIQQELDPRETSGKIAFRVIVEGERRPIHPVLRDEVYRIGREALINAFRHAQAKKIEMELKYSSKQLSILVRDDGGGIDASVLQSGRVGHWGLSGMRERAERMGAQLHVRSSAFAGTEIELAVPAKVAFQDHSNDKLTWVRQQVRRLAGGK